MSTSSGSNIALQVFKWVFILAIIGVVIYLIYEFMTSPAGQLVSDVLGKTLSAMNFALDHWLIFLVGGLIYLLAPAFGWTYKEVQRYREINAKKVLEMEASGKYADKAEVKEVLEGERTRIKDAAVDANKSFSEAERITAKEKNRAELAERVGEDKVDESIDKAEHEFHWKE
jgi:hypothetical protein